MPTYEIRVPIKETWYFEVKAKNKKEALKKYDENDESVYQTCSTGGWVNHSGEVEIVKVKDSDDYE